MIQRIQSIFLLLVAILHIILFFLPVWEAGSGTPETKGRHIDMGINEVYYDNYKESTAGPEFEGLTMATGAINISIIALSIISIFLYRRRITQLRLSRLAVILECALLALLFWIIEQSKELFPDDNFEEYYKVGLFLPIVGIILLYMAGRKILADERLVRSADRLR